MIYLIKSSGYREEEEGKISTFFLLKIGYTEDSKKNNRYINYKLHNPTCQVLYEIPEATEDHEKRVQYRFRDLLFEDYGREWFKYSEEIINFFKNIKSLKELDKLPKNPIRGDQIVLLGKRETRKILSYLFNTKEEIENYLDKLVSILGDTISYDTSLGYIREDKSIDKNKLNNYLNIIKSRKSKIYCEDNEVNREISIFLDKYNSKKTILKKLRLLCEYGLSQGAINIMLAQISDSDEIKSYYKSLGPQRLKALEYNVTKIRRELGIVTFSWDLLKQEIFSNFNEGEKYTLANLKNKLSSIYSSINYQSTPKANDIENYFEVKGIVVYEKDPETEKRKQIRGFELIKSKRDILEERLID